MSVSVTNRGWKLSYRVMPR